jgi:hypothetical protein
MPSNPTYTTIHWRFEPVGNPTTGQSGGLDWLPLAILTNAPFHLRLEIANTGTVAGTPAPRLEYSTDGGTTWNAVTNATPVQMYTADATFTDGAALSSSQLTATGTFAASKAYKSSNPGSAIAITNGFYTEVLWSLLFLPTVAGVAVKLRLTDNGTATNWASAATGIFTITPSLSPADQQASDAATLTAMTLNAAGTDTVVAFGASNGTAKSAAVYTAGKAAQLSLDTAAAAADVANILATATHIKSQFGVTGTATAGSDAGGMGHGRGTMNPLGGMRH